MANNFRIANVAARALADAFDDRVNTGAGTARIEIRTGAQPADPDTVASGTLLATVNLANPAFGAAADANPGGRITANTISDDVSADATGTAGWFRVYDRGGAAVADGEVGTAGADLNLNTTAITAGSTVSITSMTVTMPEA